MKDLSPYPESELSRLNAKTSIYKCPKCNSLLLSTTTQDGGCHLWCPQPLSICPCIGTNEGGYGKNEKAAFDILNQKLSKS